MRLTKAIPLALALCACDPAAAPLADGGVEGDGWTSCSEAVVFGEAGEACSFAGSCVECDRVPSPTQAACAGGVLRFAAAGPAACVAADGGGLSGADGGGFPLPDGGGVPLVDAGRGTDAGRPEVSCGPRRLPTPVGAVCPATVSDCIRGGGADCMAGQRACSTCTNAEIISCATEHGCDDEFGAHECCLEANCPADHACGATTCAATWGAFTTCAQGTSCRVTDHCFEESIYCGPIVFAAPAGGACAASTRTCLEAATTAEDYDACYAADPQPEACADCEHDGFYRCLTDPALPNSCAWQYGAVSCCLDTACPSGTASATCWTNAQSAGGACFDEVVAFADCANARTDCQGVFDACYP